MSRADTCNDCGSQIGFMEGVNLEVPGQAGRLLCLECFNAFMSREMKLDFEHPRFHSVEITDSAGTSHRFEIRTMLDGDVVSVRAAEPRDDGTHGYEAEVLGDPTDDPMLLFKCLYERLRRELGWKHLVETDRGLQLGDGDIVRARVAWDEAQGGRVPLLVIDGREVTWEELGQMVMRYEGWNLRLEFLEQSDELW